jgi:hypothetical protein
MNGRFTVEIIDAQTFLIDKGLGVSGIFHDGDCFDIGGRTSRVRPSGWRDGS